MGINTHFNQNAEIKSSINMETKFIVISVKFFC